MAEQRIRVRRWVEVPAFSERGMTPERLFGYALAQGWRAMAWVDGRKQVELRWGKGNGHGCVIVPFFRGYADFTRRIEEALIEIAEVAGVDPEALRRELAVD